VSHGLQRQLGFWVGVALLFHPLAVFSADTSNSVVISTSLSLRSDHQPELACDGRDDTWFLSFRPARDGDDFLLTLPAPAQLTGVTVTTGTGDGENRLEYGSLETSVDGSNFTFAAAFVHGDARVTGLKEPVRAVRLRVTGQGRAPLAIREFTLHSPTPLPKARLMTRVEVDYSATPECAFFARRAKALAEEWYPRIGEVLWKGAMPARFSVVKLHFVPGKIKDFIGYTTGNGTIMIAADWVMTHTPRDYGLVIHELTMWSRPMAAAGRAGLRKASRTTSVITSSNPACASPRSMPTRPPIATAT